MVASPAGLRLPLLVLLAVAAAECRAEAEDWVGTIVWPRRERQELRYVNDVVARFSFDAKVMRDLGEWIEVRIAEGPGPHMGCVRKSHVVRQQDAIAYFTALINADRRRLWPFVCRARCWTQKGEHEIAITDLNEAVRLNPSAELYVHRGVLLDEAKRYDDAIADYNEAIRLNPKLKEAFNCRGNSWTSKKEYDKAIADFNEAIRLNPQDAMAFNNRAESWRKKTEYDKAIADCSEAIRLDPTYSLAFHVRGNSWSNKAEYDKAIADFDQAIRLDPDLADALSGLAWLLATCPEDRFRNGIRAIELAQRANGVRNDIPGLVKAPGREATRQGSLAAAYAEAGRFDDAVKTQQKALDLATADQKPDFQAQLDLYRARKPFRVSIDATGSNSQEHPQ